jgi:flagellar P-ring protein precursor FlgI
VLAKRTIIVLALALGAVWPAHAQRIKDLASVEGVRPNQLIGYGLVVGLDGSGDQTTQTPFTTQSLNAMLSQLGINLPPGQNLQLRNVAAVMVTAMLPPFARPGQALDVTVSSMGNARSLRGGTLLLAPLRGTDGRIYAMAQGSIVIPGAGAAAGGSSAKINQLNSGRIPNGATVEREVPTPLGQTDLVNLELHSSDFGTARLITDAINQRAPGTASALDGRQVQVRAPRNPDERVSFLAAINDLTVNVPSPPAKVVINARTGSVVMNQSVTLEQAAVAHGNLSVLIQSDPVISQPSPYSFNGQTVVTERAQVQIRQEGGQLVFIPASAKLADVVNALNAMGATPQDLLAILQALKASGALRAELEII